MSKYCEVAVPSFYLKCIWVLKCISFGGRGLRQSNMCRMWFNYSFLLFSVHQCRVLDLISVICDTTSTESAWKTKKKKRREIISPIYLLRCCRRCILMAKAFLWVIAVKKKIKSDKPRCLMLCIGYIFMLETLVRHERRNWDSLSGNSCFCSGVNV